MKTTNTYFILVMLTILSIFSCESPQIEFDNEESELQKEIPSDWFFAQRAYPYGKIDKHAYISAARDKKAKEKIGLQTRSEDNWEFVGPTNIGGRVTDIEMHTSSTDIMYVGTASGGVFKSEDRGQSFAPIFDDALSLSIGDMDIAASDSNIIYVGTGEANAGGGSLAYDGLGMYRSTDAGNSWTNIGLENAGSIGKVQVHPSDPNTVFVGAMGNLFSNNGQRGVFRTKDGGATWENVLMVSDSTGIIDLVINPSNPNMIFAAAWERIRRPNRRSYAGATSGIYRSYDGGDTWTELTTGLPQINNQKGRIGLAIAPSSPNTIYSVYAGEDGFISGAFKSTNFGDSWQDIGIMGVDNVPYMWWFGKVSVHPDRPDEIYYLSLNTFKSSNSGDDWAPFFPGQHVDQHDLFIHPTDPSIIVSANDGGVYISNDAGISFEHANTLPITQFYKCEIDPSEPSNVYGGAQDNGSNFSTGATDGWVNIFGGDGFTSIVDPTNNDIVYVSIQRGVFFRINGNSFSNITPELGANDRVNWNSPSILDPFNSDQLYFGTNRLLKSTDQGDSWNPISPDLTDGELPNSNLAFGTITTISPSPAQQDLIWIGTDDGNVSVTDDGGNTWGPNTSVSDRWITAVIADPLNVEVAYYTTSGYRFGDEIGHVFKTNNLGNSWADISGNLPDVPVNDLIVHPTLGHLYIATDIGVYFSTDDGITWTPLGLGLPTVVVTDLEFHAPTNKLLAATYGRSMFSIIIDDSVPTEELFGSRITASIFPNPTRSLSVLQAEVNKKADYKIDLYNVNGQLMNTIYKGSLDPGMHKIDIDLNQFASGIYYCSIMNDTGESNILELVKVE